MWNASTQPLRWARNAPACRAVMLAAAAIGVATGVLIVSGTSELKAAPVFAVFVAAIVASVAGFAFSAICGSVLFHLIHDPLRVVQIIILCSIANQALAVWTLRRSVDLRAMCPFVASGVFGVPAGAFLLLHTEPGLYLPLLGGLLAVWAAYQLTRKPVGAALPTTVLGDMGFGFVSGLLGGFAGFAGAPVAIRCGLKGWDKDRQRGVTQPTVVILQIVALGSIVLMAPSGGRLQIGSESVAFLPASLLGTFIGLKVFRRMTDRQFHAALNGVLALSGMALAL